ncbi:hypothetical protein DL98DRAFT_368356, partial [Cadophora sp. DSE1049]
SSSTASLRPTQSLAQQTPRRLLIVYIHGFLGSEESFGSFPAHLHFPLTERLAATHVVHSKVYPRYRSRRPITYARDDFSNWLQPHEDERTDVILVGHSMGGILAAEVVLLRPISRDSNKALRHNILGIIGVDVPFLGVSPRVIGTGLASLFRSKSTVPESDPSHGKFVGADDESSATQNTDREASSGQSPYDPNFDPVYLNDKHLVERAGWHRALYFIQKHSGRLVEATAQYFKSHLQFGSCLADYPRLKRRYERLRALEDIDELKRHGNEQRGVQNRVRFVNYYSASTGRVKSPRSRSPQVALSARNAIDLGSTCDNGTYVDIAEEKSAPNVDTLQVPGNSDFLCQEDPEILKRRNVRERNFCALPKKDASGDRDRTWVPVHMGDIDEVEAHTSLFKTSNTYKLLVDDAITRIENWAHED